MQKLAHLPFKRLEELARKIKDARVCLIGDFCLDLYWEADMKISSLSRETPHFPLPVVKETASLGGGGNVTANLAALGVGSLIPISVVGDDWRGFLLRQEMRKQGISSDFLVTALDRITPCYCKPLRTGISDTVYEDPRLDFENFAPLSVSIEEQVLAALDAAEKNSDIIAVCDQYRFGVITARIRQRLAEIGTRIPVVVDSRENAAAYTGVIIKPNEVEAAKAAGTGACFQQPEEFARLAELLSERTGNPVIITLGEQGALWYQAQKEAVFAPTTPKEPPVDIVGAGDTFLSAFCAAYAAGAAGGEALAFANLASGVTVKKLGTTGTATIAEIFANNGEDER